MSFDILRQLQYCTGSCYGDNLNMVPSRIIPISLVEDISGNETNNDGKINNIIYYIPPRLGKEYVICNTENKLPEPSAYFRSPNTFLKSLLYLSNVNYYDNVCLPLKADTILNAYIRDIFEEQSTENIQSYKKLIQIIMNNTGGTFDTDPDKNPFFSKFIKVILKKEKYDIIIIRANDAGYYFDTVPSKLPKLNLISGKPNYILLLHSNGLYSPYGKAYVSIDDKK
jgi:hypothetical protein